MNKGFQKAIPIVTVFFALILQGCGRNITIEEFMDANSIKQLLSHHEAIHFVYEGYGFSEDLYFNDDLTYLEYDDIAFIINDSENWQYNRDDGTLSRMWYIMKDIEADEARMKKENYGILGDRTTLEDITHIKDNGDGTTTIKSIISLADSEKILQESYSNLPNDYYSSKIKREYLVNTDTLELICYDFYLVKAGKETHFGRAIVDYDDDPPELMRKMLTGISKYNDREEHPVTKKIINAIYDKGSAGEESFEFVTDADCKVALMWRDGYAPDTDRNEDYTDPDGTVHITRYATKD